jgi:transposase
MVVVGIDAHKRTHTAVAVDERGRQLGVRTFQATTSGHLAMLRWAGGFAGQRRWAVEDCRNMTRRLERDLLGAGEQVVRVPPKLMAKVRDSARSYGKSDPIDALATARAALREDDLPTARLDGPERELRLLVDHREALLAERSAAISRLRWHLHELDPAIEPAARTLHRPSTQRSLAAALAEHTGTVARLAAALLQRCQQLTTEITALATELKTLTEQLAPALLAIPGCAHLTAAKIIGETADITRFRSRDAYARHNGTAPLPVWSSNQTRHRLSRAGNRQLNAALHRIALTQARCHPPARELLARRRANGDGGLEALRVLKRRLSDVVYRALHTDTPTPN